MRLITILVLVLAASPISAVAKKPPIPQFVVVRKLPPDAVLKPFQAACLQNNMSIAQATPSQVTCTKPMDDSLKSFFIRALATPSYSSNPVYHYQVSAIRIGMQTTVSIKGFVQYQNAYGQLTTIPLDNRKELENIAQGLQGMKERWEAKLDANGDNEIATMEEVEADQDGSRTDNLPANTSRGPDQPGQAAHQFLKQLNCQDNVRVMEGTDGVQRYQGTCSDGSILVVECEMGACSVAQ